MTDGGGSTAMIANRQLGLLGAEAAKAPRLQAMQPSRQGEVRSRRAIAAEVESVNDVSLFD